MKFKTLVLAISALSFLSAGYAQVDNTSSMLDTQSSTHKNGFYVGAGAGVMGLFNTQKTTTAITDTDGVSGNTQTVDAGNANINGTVFAGYAWYLPKQTFLGLELFDNLTNTGGNTSNAAEVQTSTSVNTTNSMTLENVYGIRALPGYQVTPSTTMYGIVGFARAHARSNGSTLITIDGGQANGGSGNDSSNFNGYQLGLGSMVNITEHLAIRGDLIFTNYQNVTLKEETVALGGGSSIQINATSQPSTVEGNISLVYMFD